MTENQNTYRSGFVDGIRRVNPAKLSDDIKDGDRKYIAGYAVGYLLKLVLIVAGAYYGIDVAAVV